MSANKQEQVNMTDVKLEPCPTCGATMDVSSIVETKQDTTDVTQADAPVDLVEEFERLIREGYSIAGFRNGHGGSSKAAPLRHQHAHALKVTAAREALNKALSQLTDRDAVSHPSKERDMTDTTDPSELIALLKGSASLLSDDLQTVVDLIQSQAAENERLREALSEIVKHCANTGKGNPIVDERIIDRCEETATQALAPQD